VVQHVRIAIATVAAQGIAIATVAAQGIAIATVAAQGIAIATVAAQGIAIATCCSAGYCYCDCCSVFVTGVRTLCLAVTCCSVRVILLLRLLEGPPAEGYSPRVDAAP